VQAAWSTSYALVRVLSLSKDAINSSPERIERPMPSVTYEIRVEGVVPLGVLENVEGVSAVAAATDTTLRAQLPDTSALNGLLATLRREGLVLLEVRRDLWAGNDDVLDIDDHRP
jgi:hypothetical protein